MRVLRQALGDAAVAIPQLNIGEHIVPPIAPVTSKVALCVLAGTSAGATGQPVDHRYFCCR